MRAWWARGWALTLLLAAMCGAGVAAPRPQPALDGRVTRVIDGDSLVFEASAPEGKPAPAPLEVRLDGVDAPEGCQDWGRQAHEALAEFVLGKPVRLVTKGRDTYGRTLATAYVDTLNVNERMVAEGHAWSSRYKWDKGPYVEKERVAKALKRGLHGSPGAVPPKEFRRTHGRCAERSETAAASSSPPPAALPTAAAGPTTDGGRRCDGRTRCAQMRSCDEAKWFLAHCPGVEMDGNRDGVPCERQWCGR